MAKLVKNNYYTSKGEKKINSFNVSISKKVVEAAGFTGDEKIKVYAKDGKIIIEKVED